MQNEDLLSNDLAITPISRSFLNETAKWAKFLAILGFVVCGLTAIAAFFLPFLMSFMPSDEMVPMSGAMAKGMGVFLTILYLVIAGLMLIPCLYLYRFSTKMKIALLQTDSDVLDASFGNMKSFFKFYGIMTIISISFYLLLFIIAIAGASLFSSGF